MLNGKEIESVNLGEIDTSKITDMSELFADSERECFNGIETWDTSSVENMRRMFAGASCFNQPLDKWNVSNVRDMQGMFYGTESFNQPLDSWDTGKVVTMMGMFAGAKSFNQNLDSWDISNVRYMNDIFKDSPLQDNPPKWWKK
ncbi:hypothetical protein CQA44_08155 [Helicobacter sp. MIT 14-3879]|nr:hypothetical protein CQA44_08155 [Helicobacter sp. MIT 14-3879]